MQYHHRDHNHQDFSHFVGYLTEKQWADMKANPGESMELLVGHLIALGLMHPTEPTVQKMTAVMIMATQGAAGMHAMPPQALHESFKQIKKRTKTLKRTPQVYMLELPMSPDTYRKRYPDMYKALYQEQGPVHCPLSYPELAIAQEHVPMRARKEGEVLAFHAIHDGTGADGTNGANVPRNDAADADAKIKLPFGRDSQHFPRA